MRHLNIALMLPSAMMTAGLSLLIRRVPEVSCSVVEISGITIRRACESAACHTYSRSGQFGCGFQLHQERLVLAGQAHSPSGPADAEERYALPLTDSFSCQRQRETIIETIRRNTALNEDDDKGKDLSPREKEVIVGIVKGFSNKEIASEMNVSVNTVMTHRRNIASKLHIHTPAGLTIYAIVSNLVKLEDIKSDMSRL